MKHFLLVALLSATCATPVLAGRRIVYRHPARPPMPVVRQPAPVQQTIVVRPDPAAAREAARAGQAAAASVAAQQERMNREHSKGSEERVVEHLRLRTEDGSADAPWDLAQRYEEGKGVRKDAAEARRYCELAAERGNRDARRWLTRHPGPSETPKPAASLDQAGTRG